MCGWMRRRKGFRFPADISWRLEALGRHTLDPMRNRLGDDVADFLPRLYDAAQADPVGFLIALRAVAESDDGGFVTYGAARLVWEYFGDGAWHLPGALPIIDAGIDFKLARGLARLHLTGYEARRLDERFPPHGPRPSEGDMGRPR